MFTFFSKRNQKGFTLIELLVSIAIIGILASIVIASLSTSRAKSRDGKRIADLKQMQAALENYYDACKEYPSALTLLVSGGECPSGVGSASAILPSIARDPLVNSGHSDYVYSQSSSQQFTLQAYLESYNGALEGDGDTSNNNQKIYDIVGP